MAAWLFHGPRAREEALKWARDHGRLVVDPMGETGLGVEEAREAADLLRQIPMGDDLGVVVIGPVEDASDRAANALLKSIEDHDSRYVVPVLWAEDIGSVLGTIRSRCHEVWCPGPETDLVFEKVAEKICRAALEGRVLALHDELKDNEGQEEDILRAAVKVLSVKTSWPLEKRVRLWESLRETLDLYQGRLSFMVAFVAFLV